MVFCHLSIIIKNIRFNLSCVTVLIFVKIAECVKHESDTCYGVSYRLIVCAFLLDVSLAELFHCCVCIKMPLQCYRLQ